MEQNFWSSKKASKYPTLERDLECDVAIIGGGLAGIMCAESLNGCGMKICIFEANTICSGESANSSAMITYAHDLIYHTLTKKHGISVAKKYYELNKQAQKHVQDLGASIDCDYRHCDFTIFATTKNGAKQLEQEREIYKKLNLSFTPTKDCELPFPVTSTMTIPAQGCLNPYRFVTKMCENLKNNGVEIYEQSRAITEPVDNKLKIGEHIVKAKHFIIATHFPYINAPGYYFTKMYQSRSHNAVYNTDLRLANMYESAEDNGFEYRPTDSGTLCGGCAVRTGRYKSPNYYKTLDAHMTAKFEATTADAVAHFSAQDCITFDDLPFIGRYANSMPNVYVVTGFNKWGFTTSAVAARIIADLIQGKETDNIFEPSRLYALKSPIKELRNIACDIVGFGGRLTVDSKSIAEVQIGEGKTIKINGERVGVFRREDGGLDAIKAACPHMG